MKKIFIVLLAVCLSVSFFALPAFAADSVEIVEENVENGVIDDGGEVIAPPIEESPTDEDFEPSEEDTNEAFYSAWIDKITDSTMWINLSTNVLAALATIIFVMSTLGKIKGGLNDLLHGKVTADQMKLIAKEAFEEAIKELREATERVCKREEELAEAVNILMSALAVFMLNTKINSCAKAEIMNMLNGIHKLGANVAETVQAANAAIEKARESEEKISTPALDAVCEAAEKASVMQLG